MIQDYIHLISDNGIPIFEHHIEHERPINYCNILNQNKINNFYSELNKLTAEYTSFFEGKIGEIVEQEIKKHLENFEHKNKDLWICGFMINHSLRGNPYLYLDEDFGEKNFSPIIFEYYPNMDKEIENKFYQQVLCPLFTEANPEREKIEQLIKKYPTPKKELYKSLGKSIEIR